jgi:hypothetical protein
MRMLDLFSGLGGASEAFLQAGWDVTRYDNNELLKDVPNTTIIDLLDPSFEYWDDGPFDFIWASPPCLEFSQGYNAPRMKAKREGIDFEPNMNLIVKSVEIISYFQPKYWVIENVKGSVPYITKALGKPPRQIVTDSLNGPFFFWGVFPYICLDRNFKHTKDDNIEDYKLKSQYRAKIPLEISQAFLAEVTDQTTLKEWY